MNHPAIRDILPSVTPALASVEILKREVYTLGTSIASIASQSGLSTDTVKSILVGNNVEQSTNARFEAWLRALARNEFSFRPGKRTHIKGELKDPKFILDRRYFALNIELWREYQSVTMHPDKFRLLDRRKKFILLMEFERRAKLFLIKRHKPFIDRHRLWLPDGWSYWRWKRFIAEKMLESPQ